MRTFVAVFIAAFFCFTLPAQSQEIAVNHQNRTVEVSVTEKIQAEADIADVTLGCVSYGETHDQAYRSNLEIADRVVKALLEAGLQKTQIRSAGIQLNETDSEHPPASNRQMRQFRAYQSWRIRLAAPDAQKLIDVAVHAGSNGVESVSWDVADPEALEGRARAAAMEKARTTAANLAKSAGNKVGDLLYVSNVFSGIIDLPLDTRDYTSFVVLGSGVTKQSFSLQLFPEKVERQATVRVVFALE